MGKRFTATEKWDDPWYRKLSCKNRSIWQFLVDKCDTAGVWIVDQEMLSFFIGNDVNIKDFVSVANVGKERLRFFDNDSKLLILEFVPFQYGKLSANCKPHLSILKMIDKHLPKGYPKGIHTLEEKEEEKETEKEEEKETEKKPWFVGITFKKAIAQIDNDYAIGITSEKAKNKATADLLAYHNGKKVA